MNNGIVWLLGLTLLLFTAVDTSAQTSDRVELRLGGLPQTVRPGEKFDIRLVAKIEDGWHVYGLTKIPGGPIPTQITLSSGQPFTLAGEIGAQVPTVERDSAFGVDVEYYQGEAEFTLPVMADKKARPGRRRLEVNVRFQVCSGSMCLRPQTVKLTAPVSVGSTTSSRKKTG